MQRDHKPAIWGWAMYDWANSAFATTIIAGFFPVFFKEFWSAGVDPTVSTARLGVANALEGLVVALLAPILGAIADQGAAKKKFLAGFAFLGILMTSSLALIAQGNWPLAVGVFVLGNIGFSGGNIFYDALLTAVASEKTVDVVSAFGFALGYLGGGLLFAVNVWMTLQPAAFGLANTTAAVRAAFLTVGVWWALFSLPLLLLVQEPAGAAAVAGWRAVSAGFRQLRETFQAISRIKNIGLFLLAYWLYIDGVGTIIRMAVDYGMSIGLQATDLIGALLLTQFIGFPAALGYGFLGRKIGGKRAIYLAIAAYLGVCVFGAFMSGKGEAYRLALSNAHVITFGGKQQFYLLASVIGLFQGGIQALSRSFYAKIIPADKSAEYFGFYNMLGKFAAVLGPVLIGGVGLMVKAAGYSSNLASRVSIVSLALLFLAGGLLFAFVKETKSPA